MTQHAALVSIAPGLYRLLNIITGDEKEELRTCLQAPYQITSEHLLLCVFGDLRAFLAMLRKDGAIGYAEYFDLVGQANRLYSYHLELC